MAKQRTHLATWSGIHWRKLMDTGSVAVNPLSTITIWQIKIGLRESDLKHWDICILSGVIGKHWLFLLLRAWVRMQEKYGLIETWFSPTLPTQYVICNNTTLVLWSGVGALQIFWQYSGRICHISLSPGKIRDKVYGRGTNIRVSWLARTRWLPWCFLSDLLLSYRGWILEKLILITQ